MRMSSQNFLRKISTFQQFSKDEYIFHEGQVGKEMHIVLAGKIGVYINEPNGFMTQISTIEKGGFCGEMALFDNMPRSASCIALENTICATINKSNLPLFLENCPDIVENILSSMSSRIRDLNDKLYRATNTIQIGMLEDFSIPHDYVFGSKFPEPHQKVKYISVSEEICPICGNILPVIRFKRNIIPHKIDENGISHYEDCDPLWHDIISCPSCLYSNHYLHFFNVNSANLATIKTVLNEQHRVVSHLKRLYNSPFDNLVLKYLQAIHLNSVMNANEEVLIKTMKNNLDYLRKLDREYRK